MNPTLGKLPRVSAIDSAAPQDVTALITNDNSDIRPKPIGIDYPIVTIGNSQNFFSCRATVNRARRALYAAQSLLPRLLTRILSQIHHQRHRRRKTTDLIKSMALAIFDLDNTLIAGDSDHRWGQFLCDIGLADPQGHAETNDRFYADYQAGTLDITAYLSFALAPIAGKTTAEVAALQRRFMHDCFDSMQLPKAIELIEQHRKQGDHLLIISATHTVVTRPIADQLGIDDLIASEAEIIDGVYSGDPVGTPSFQTGKIVRLEAWCAEHSLSVTGATFYSDSHNDLPLLRYVDHAVAVDPDPQLRAVASAYGWPVLSLR